MHPYIYQSPCKQTSPITNKFDFVNSPISSPARNPLFSPNRNPFAHSPSQLPTLISPRKLQHINCILPKTEEEGGLYIGDTISTLKQDIIFSNGIQAILCCNLQASNNLRKFVDEKAKPELKFINIQDHQLYPIKLHFQQAFQYIDKNRQNKKNVLIQCHGGVSRSGTILCSYLMRKNQWSLTQAYKFVTQKRPRIKPNIGFWKQLQQYSTILERPVLQENIKENQAQIQFNNKNKGQIKQQNAQKQRKFQFLYQTPKRNNDKSKVNYNESDFKYSQDKKEIQFIKQRILNQNANPQIHQCSLKQNMSLRKQSQNFSENLNNLKHQFKEAGNKPIKINNQIIFSNQLRQLNYQNHPMHDIINKNQKFNVIYSPSSQNLRSPISSSHRVDKNKINFGYSPRNQKLMQTIIQPKLDSNNYLQNKFFLSQRFNTQN